MYQYPRMSILNCLYGTDQYIISNGSALVLTCNITHLLGTRPQLASVGWEEKGFSKKNNTSHLHTSTPNCCQSVQWIFNQDNSLNTHSKLHSCCPKMMSRQATHKVFRQIIKPIYNAQKKIVKIGSSLTLGFRETINDDT